MWVKEKTVHSPWERFPSLVQIIIARNFGKDTIVLCSKMVQVRIMFDLRIVNPCNAYGNGRNTDEVADLPPELSSV